MISIKKEEKTTNEYEERAVKLLVIFFISQSFYPGTYNQQSAIYRSDFVYDIESVAPWALDSLGDLDNEGVFLIEKY